MFVIGTDIQLEALPSLNGSLLGSSKLDSLMFPADMVSKAEKCSECQVEGDAKFLPHLTPFHFGRTTKVIVPRRGETYL